MTFESSHENQLLVFKWDGVEKRRVNMWTHPTVIPAPHCGLKNIKL